MRTYFQIWVVAGLLFLASNSVDADDWFDAEDVSITSYHLFDMGVAKVNSDEILDIFTTNHSDDQGIYFGSGDASFSTNKVTQTGLNQDLEFPGLEGRRRGPKTPQNGLYIYWLYGKIYLYSSSATPVYGYVEFPSSVEDTSTTGGANVVVSNSEGEGEGDRDFPQARVEFEFESPGEFNVQPRHVGVPFQVHLDQSVLLEKVYVGWKRVQPRSHTFEAVLLDRHGYAWSDLDDNGTLDVFITRGGLHGDIGSYPSSLINDELLLQFDGGFVDVAEPSGIRKLGGRGRQAAWVDVNSDGRLDLYVGNLGSPNLLFLQNQEGGFLESAENYGLNLRNSGAFVWLDADSDSDMDLLIKDVGARTIKFLRNQPDGTFSEEVLLSNAGVALVQWTQADMDRDGDVDVFMASTQGSKLLINDGLQFRVVDPGEFGLPDSGISAQFVDFDNNSRMDLHLVPGGIFRQQSTGTFYRTRHLRDIYPQNSNRVWGLWFDADIDGKVDLMTVHRLPISEGSDRNRYSAGFYRNIGASNNWLQVDLYGPEGNSSAIGAKVELIQNDPAKKLVQFVGTSEGSRYSQGHFRLYFGLSKMRKVQGLRIYWPNGEVQLHPPTDVNQLIEIHYDSDSLE